MGHANVQLHVSLQFTTGTPTLQTILVRIEQILTSKQESVITVLGICTY